jgi:hypothetical protein
LVLHLHPQQGVQSLLGEGARLKQLVLHKCKLLEQGRGFAAALAAALSARPELQHLSIDMPNLRMGFPSRVLQKLQQLTYLELSGMQLHSRDALRHLHALTRLQELRLAFIEGAKAFQAVVVSGLQRLSVLKVKGLFDGRLWLGVLAGSPRLQHLEVSHGGHLGGAAGVADFWSYLQNQRQLTYLSLSNSICYWESLPPAVYAALTASSHMQHLAISECELPAGVWQHIFPAGRQLPHLQTLQIDRLHEPSRDLYRECAVTAPNARVLVSCCPGLRSLSMEALVYTAERLAPLTGLSALQDLHLDSFSMSAEGWEVVGQLTGLRQLILQGCREVGSMQLLQLTQLQQLSHLRYKAYYGEESGTWTAVSSWLCDSCSQFQCIPLCDARDCNCCQDFADDQHAQNVKTPFAMPCAKQCP